MNAPTDRRIDRLANTRVVRSPRGTEKTAKMTSGSVMTHGDSCGSCPWVTSRKRSLPRNVSTNKRVM